MLKREQASQSLLGLVTENVMNKKSEEIIEEEEKEGAGLPLAPFLYPLLEPFPSADVGNAMIPFEPTFSLTPLWHDKAHSHDQLACVS